MQIDVVANCASGDDRIFFVLFGEPDKRIVDGAVDDRALLDPANLVFLGFDLQKAAAVLQDF